MDDFSKEKKPAGLVIKSQTEEMLYFSDKLDIPFITLANYEIPAEAIKLLPERTCRNFKVIPLASLGPAVTVAVADPLNVLILDELRTLTGLEVHPVVGTPLDIMNTINAYYSIPLPEETGKAKSQVEEETEAIEIEIPEKVEETDIHKLTSLVEEGAIVAAVNDIIFGALKQSASDIHIEPFEETLRIRYRVDGMLGESKLLPKDIHEGFIARLKIMSRLDITQRRLPQDGRFTINFQDRDIDFRVSVLPTNFGEKVVLRILDKGSMKLDLPSLGFSPYALEIYNKVAQFPFGMLLVTGPTGSGKSTTLYSMINLLNTSDKNIVTIEDPIEYHLSGITQIQIKPEIGLTFANCLRSVLRQSPDIIMLGEIRDTETADIAMKASLTGHLVLSTLHTNDAPTSITRLMDMGVESFLIVGSLVMASAQRLCRRLCPNCKVKQELSANDIAKKLNLTITQEKVEIYEPAGCQQCNKNGYIGRVAVVEAFVVDDVIKQMILNNSPAIEIKRYAQEKRGMKTLREDGLAKVLSGETSWQEIIRVTAEF